MVVVVELVVMAAAQIKQSKLCELGDCTWKTLGYLQGFQN
jgi:hypothetical protein